MAPGKKNFYFISQFTEGIVQRDDETFTLLNELA